MRKVYLPIKLSLIALLFAVISFAGNQVQAQYCLPTYTNQCTSGDFIDGVEFVTINNTGTGCASPSVNNYTDYSGSIGTTVAINQANSITLYPGANWGQYFVVFIDLNQDSDFADAGEFFDIGYAAAGANVTGSITVPITALTGTTRMRVMCQFGTTPLTQADVCGTPAWGEVEDYALTILPPPAYDMGLTTAFSPASGCALSSTETMSVQAVNFGSNSTHYWSFCYTVNGGAPVCEVYADTTAPGDTVNYTFSTPADLSVPGNYTIQYYINNAGPSDTNPVNDTLNSYVVSNYPVIASLPYSEDFDTDDGGWSAGGTVSSWAWGAPSFSYITGPSSSPNAWVTNLTGDYNDGENSHLLSPCFDFGGLSTDPFLVFSHIYKTEGCCDEGWVEVSTDAGATWTKLGTSGAGMNWYNDAANEWWDDSSGTAGQWRYAGHSLTGTAGFSDVKIRFVFSSDGSVTEDGFGVDDIYIFDTLWNASVTEATAPVSACGLTSAETVTIRVANDGSHAMSNVPVCFRVDGGSWVCETVPGPIPAGGDTLYTFTATADLSTVGAHNLDAYAAYPGDLFNDGDSLSWTVIHIPTISTFPYVEDFESGMGGWSDSGANNTWAFGTPAKNTIIGAASGVNAWVTGGLSTGVYNNLESSFVTGPCMDFTSLSNPWFKANIWWNAEFSWDGTVLEYTTDGGATWVEVGTFGDPFNWYTDNTIGGLAAPLNTGNGWTGRASSGNGSGGWVTAMHDLSGLAGESSVQLRFHFGTDASVQDDGFAFDDVVIADVTPVSLGPDTTSCFEYDIMPSQMAGTFAWSTGDTTVSINVDSSGIYAVAHADSFGFPSWDTVMVTILQGTLVDLGMDASVCTGDTACLSPLSGNYTSVVWSTGDTTSTLCVTSTGSYYAMGTDSNGCSSTDTAMVSVMALPTVNLGPDSTICAGDTLCLDAGSHAAYSWSNGDSVAVVCVTPGNYAVMVTDSMGCMNSDSISIGTANAPVAAFTADTSACPVISFTDGSTDASGWSWDFGDGNTGSTQNPSNDYTAAGNGTYTVMLVSENGCGTDTTTMEVTISCLMGVADGFAGQLSVYPNPNTGRFSLELPLSTGRELTIEVVSLQGQILYREDVPAGAGTFRHEIELPGIAAGTYFLRVSDGSEVAVRKLFVE